MYVCTYVLGLYGRRRRDVARRKGGKVVAARSFSVLARPKVTGWKSFCQRERDMKIAALMKNAKS